MIPVLLCSLALVPIPFGARPTRPAVAAALAILPLLLAILWLCCNRPVDTEDLAALGTDADKPFLETAPWLVIVFKQVRNPEPSLGTEQVYYANESVGIAVGMFLAAAQFAGLSTLTHTPSPMKFLGDILGRPEHERAFMVIPVGHPAKESTHPDIRRKPLEAIMRVDRNRTPNEDEPARPLPSSMPPPNDA